MAQKGNLKWSYKSDLIKVPKFVVSHTCQGQKISGNLEVRNATCFLKMNPFIISIFFMFFSFDTALQKSGGPVPLAPPVSTPLFMEEILSALKSHFR